MMNTYNMTNEEFEMLVKSAKNYNEVKDFIENIGYQEWMDNYSDAEEGETMSEREIEEIDEILTEIFEAAHDEDDGEYNAVKELKEEIGMTISEFAEYFGIPQRTVLSWNCGDRECATYLVDLMRYKAEKEGLIGNNCTWTYASYDGSSKQIIGETKSGIFPTGFGGDELSVVEMWEAVKEQHPEADNYAEFKKVCLKR